MVSKKKKPIKPKKGKPSKAKVKVDSVEQEKSVQRVDDISIIKTDREGFIESHPKYQAYYNYMTNRLTAICREEEKKTPGNGRSRKKSKGR